jgi:Tannase and feruloyl esterase
LNSIKYYNSVVAAMGGEAKASNNVRLFLEPGMGHCGGGEGPNVFDKVGPLEKWVETAKLGNGLRLLTAPAGKSIARVHCIPILRSPNTRAREVSMKP